MARRLNLLFTAYLLIATTCNAMENNTIAKPTILMELTCIKESRKALYFAENRVLINGDKQCSIVDPNTNKEIKRIFNNNIYSSCISVHPNKTKFAFSAHYPPERGDNQKITIYDAITGTPEHTIHWDGCSVTSLLFSLLDDTIAIGSHSTDVTLYNYQTNKATRIYIAEAHAEHLKGYDVHRPIISLHPTQPLMCLAWKNIYIHNLETSVTIKKPGSSYYQEFCEYSPDGSFIARGDTAQIIIMKPNLLLHGNVTAQQARISSFYNMAIHPNSKVLITLSTPGGIVQYWNIETCKLISEISSLSSSGESYQSSSSLSFSPNGTKLLLVLYGKCAIFAVPFEVIYQSDTKQNLLYFLLFLKNHLHEQDVLPHDIIQLLMQNLIEAFKR